MNIEDKISEAVDLLKRYEPMDGYHLAFSGGKDSICCCKLCELAGVKYTAVYSICTVESKETIPFIRKYYPNTQFDRSGTSLYKLIVKKGLPIRTKRYCCEYLKEYSGKGKLVITGVRRDESNNRKKRRLLEIDTRKKHEGKCYINPIVSWSIDDVWEFIKKYKLPTPEIYTDCKTARGGCIGCPMSHNQRYELETNPKYKNAYIKAIRKRMQLTSTRGKNKGKKYFGNFKDEYDVYNWWVSGESIKNYKAKQRQTEIKFD